MSVIEKIPSHVLTGPGSTSEGFETGKIVEVWTKRGEFRKGAGIAITKIEHHKGDRFRSNPIVKIHCHGCKHTKEKHDKKVAGVNGFNGISQNEYRHG